MSDISKIAKDIAENTTLSESVRKMVADAERYRTSSALDASSMFPDIPRFSMPKPPSHEEIHEYQSASVFLESLSQEAMRWKNSVPENYETAIVALLYGGIQIKVSRLFKVSFHGIKIDGHLGESPCSILAHQTTVQMLCYAEKVKPDTPRNPIGFIWDEHEVEV